MTADISGDLAVRRKAALHSFEILDSAAERSFDSLVQLASSICGTPIALISLLDDHRQWFKARVGLDASETPLSMSFCARAVETESADVFVVLDATADPRFRDNPLVTGSPDVRFYAGAPLITSDRIPLGTLCVIDTAPRQMTESQLSALKILAQQAVCLLEFRRVASELARTVTDLKILQGKLPVCMYCRRLQSESGEWMQLETYIRSKTDAEFSHGVCPNCFVGKCDGHDPKL